MFRAPVLDIYITGTCNLVCPYCFGEDDKKPGMEREMFKRALGFAHFAGASTIELCGGEPLLYKDFEWAVDLARSEGFALILRTNGLLIAKRRALIAANFSAVGLSLDGDGPANDRLRPLKGSRPLTAEDKFEMPLSEIAALKALNPGMRIILASVATAENLEGILALGRILLARRPPLDLWKIHQFVSNNFRAIETKDRFSVPQERFAALEIALECLIGEAFAFSCRTADKIDGSCLVINRDGDALLGAQRFGNIARHSFEEIGGRLGASGAELAVATNKISTYRAALPTMHDI